MPDFCGTKSKPPSSTPGARQHCNVRTCYHDGTVTVAPYRGNLGAIGTILCGVARKAQCWPHQAPPDKPSFVRHAHSLYPNPYGVWPNRQAVRMGPQDALCDDRAISEWPGASGDHLRSACSLLELWPRRNNGYQAISSWGSAGKSRRPRAPFLGRAADGGRTGRCPPCGRQCTTFRVSHS